MDALTALITGQITEPFGLAVRFGVAKFKSGEITRRFSLCFCLSFVHFCGILLTVKIWHFQQMLSALLKIK